MGRLNITPILRYNLPDTPPPPVLIVNQTLFDVFTYVSVHYYVLAPSYMIGKENYFNRFLLY